MPDESLVPVPRAVFFAKGVGRHRYRPQSLELAMRHAGIEKYNLVQVSGILPSRCKIITVTEGLRRLTPGQIVYGAWSESSSDEPNRLLCAGIGVALPVKDQYGYMAEHHGFGMTEERIGDFVEDMAATMLAAPSASPSTPPKTTTNARKFTACPATSSAPATSSKPPKATKTASGPPSSPPPSSSSDL
jgi:arginine decarboxylase